MSVMLRGLDAKIESSQEVKNFLIDTMQYELVDCTYGDYESCGFKHWHPFAAKPSQFTGYNLLAISLSFIRRHLF